MRLTIIWAIFTLLFLIKSMKEWLESKKDIKVFETIRLNTTARVVILGVDFSEVFESLKEVINKSNQESHKIATTSYFLAGLTALASLIVSLY